MKISVSIGSALFVLLFAAHTLFAACPSPERVGQSASNYFGNRPSPAYLGLTVDEAYCAQSHYVALLESRLGPRGGYKVGFTGKASQQRFGVSEPARGVMFKSMFLESGTVIDANFATRPLREADMVVKVKDAGIMEAKTLLEVAQHLESVIPFIELPSVIIDRNDPLTGPGIIAYNVAARLGVIGKGIPVQANAAFVDAFADMDVIFTNDLGEELLRTKGSALMGNPLNVVLWLIDNLKQYNMALRAGDLVSLGTMGALGAPQPGRTLTLRFEGLPGGSSEAVVTFR